MGRHEYFNATDDKNDRLSEVHLYTGVHRAMVAIAPIRDESHVPFNLQRLSMTPIDVTPDGKSNGCPWPSRNATLHRWRIDD
jgi:hypothetical protein